MAERIKLNKVSLRDQKQKLSLYRRFLPALEARKQQFLVQLTLVRQEIKRQESALAAMREEIAVWSSLLRDMEDLLRYHLAVREVRCDRKNVAGIRIPVFEAVLFADPTYSVFATPYSFETVLSRLRQAITLREEIAVLREQERLLSEGIRRTSQRINLYEQRLIPGCRQAVRRITVYLQDQQAAAVGVAKVAQQLARRT
jgi:V/A-type H+-transporting ATPase subunit D